MDIKMSGEILNGEGNTFTVRFEFTHIPSESRASELAAVIHQAIEDVVAAKGGRLAPCIGAAPMNPNVPRLILPN